MGHNELLKKALSEWEQLVALRRRSEPSGVRAYLSKAIKTALAVGRIQGLTDAAKIVQEEEQGVRDKKDTRSTT
jgi:hypothetical protein